MTLWISFLVRRDNSLINSYARFSLFDSGTEELFIGVPINRDQWGLHVWDFGNRGGISVENPAPAATRQFPILPAAGQTSVFRL